MPRIDSEVRITPSVIDRLIDEAPGVSEEVPATRSRSLQQLKQAVKRDLEWLLNTRQVFHDLPEDLVEVSHSLAAYGLPDFTGASVKSGSEQNRVCREIREAVAAFEPRLADVNVTLVPAREGERSLHFRIDAQLEVEPAPEPVTFDTVLQLTSGEFEVQGQ